MRLEAGRDRPRLAAGVMGGTLVMLFRTSIMPHLIDIPTPHRAKAFCMRRGRATVSGRAVCEMRHGW